jgi:hypothetical protein
MSRSVTRKEIEVIREIFINKYNEFISNPTAEKYNEIGQEMKKCLEGRDEYIGGIGSLKHVLSTTNVRSGSDEITMEQAFKDLHKKVPEVADKRLVNSMTYAIMGDRTTKIRIIEPDAEVSASSSHSAAAAAAAASAAAAPAAVEWPAAAPEERSLLSADSAEAAALAAPSHDLSSPRQESTLSRPIGTSWQADEFRERLEAGKSSSTSHSRSSPSDLSKTKGSGQGRV